MSREEAYKNMPGGSGVALRWPWLTLLMTLALVIAYMWMARKAGGYGPYDATTLTELGANVAPLSATGDFRRLWTSLFLHESWGHLLQNAAVLLIVGATLESLTSRGVWLFVYAVGGLFAAWMSAVWHFDYSTVSMLGAVRQVVYVSVGASGAILSLAGAELALALAVFLSPGRAQAKIAALGNTSHEHDTARASSLLRGALMVPVLTLVYGMFDASVDNIAHVAGFGFGLAAGLAVALVHKGWLVSGVAALGGLACAGWVAWAGYVRVHGLPERDAIRGMAVTLQDEQMEARRREQLLETEVQSLPPEATPDEARGIVIAEPFIGRVIPTAQPGRVQLLKNYDEAEVMEYDLEQGRRVATWLKQKYPAGKTWGCPAPQCHGIGVTDMALSPDQSKAFFSNLQAGRVSRVNRATGKVEFSVPTGSFPVRLLAHEGRVYVHDWVDASLTVLDARDGKVLQTHQLGAVDENRRAWPDGGTMALSADGRRLYVASRQGKVTVLDVEKETTQLWQPPRTDHGKEHTHPPELDRVRRIGVGGQGAVWLLHPDGVSYPEGETRRQHVVYKLSTTGRPPMSFMRDAYLGTSGEHGLILFVVDGYVLASSSQTGQLLRVYPLAFPESSLLVLDVLDDRRFYVAGREGLQIFDVDKALRVDPVATDYQLHLDRQRQGARLRY